MYDQNGHLFITKMPVDARNRLYLIERYLINDLVDNNRHIEQPVEKFMDRRTGDGLVKLFFAKQFLEYRLNILLICHTKPAY